VLMRAQLRPADSYQACAVSPGQVRRYVRVPNDDLKKGGRFKNIHRLRNLRLDKGSLRRLAVDRSKLSLSLICILCSQLRFLPFKV
jgi:hypothetical protein